MDFRNLNKDIHRIAGEMSEVASYLWQKGWAERNAGNMSVNISEFVTSENAAEILTENHPFYPLPLSLPALAGNYFLVTGTGKRMRDIARDFDHNALMIRISDDAKGFLLIKYDPGQSNLMPTSELPSHFSIHEQLIRDGKRERTVVHTHPNELVSLTHIREYCDQEALNNLLWGMHPETMVVVPEGAGFVPYLLTGSLEIAEATLQKFKHHQVVVWEKHGCFAIGKDVFEAFDLIDTIAKSALIYFQCRTAGYQPEGLTTEQLAELKILSEKFKS
jgi:rhamnulose-1-phosphate aldolase